MTPLFKKLNYKDQPEVCIINAPESFDKEIQLISGQALVVKSLSRVKSISFFLAFVTRQNEVDQFAHDIDKVVQPDAVIWFAYPKGTSRKYKCEFNRDNGWKELGAFGFEPVRMVAIDEDWSALRFKKAESIKTMTRSVAISEVGKKKITPLKKTIK